MIHAIRAFNRRKGMTKSHTNNPVTSQFHTGLLAGHLIGAKMALQEACFLGVKYFIFGFAIFMAFWGHL